MPSYSIGPEGQKRDVLAIPFLERACLNCLCFSLSPKRPEKKSVSEESMNSLGSLKTYIHEMRCEQVLGNRLLLLIC